MNLGLLAGSTCVVCVHTNVTIRRWQMQKWRRVHIEAVDWQMGYGHLRCRRCVPLRPWYVPCIPHAWLRHGQRTCMQGPAHACDICCALKASSIESGHLSWVAQRLPEQQASKHLIAVVRPLTLILGTLVTCVRLRCLLSYCLHAASLHLLQVARRYEAQLAKSPPTLRFNPVAP